MTPHSKNPRRFALTGDSLRIVSVAAAFAATVGLGTTTALHAADAYPCQAVRIIAPNAPGGATDVLSRMISQPLSERLGVPVVVENKGGASTNIGTEHVVRSKPDGCTLLLANISLAINKSMFKLGFDVEKDLTAVVQVAAVPLVFFVSAGVPATSMQQFVDLAKKSGGKTSFSSAGIGTPHHLILEVMNAKQGTQIIHVPFAGQGPATSAVIAGQITSTMDSLIPAVPHVKAGTVRALAVTGSSRSSVLPDIPTLTEQGFPDVDAMLWYGVLVPGQTPPALVKRLNEEIGAVLRAPALADRLRSLGSTTPPPTAESFQRLIHAEAARWGDVVRTNNIKPE